MAEETALVNGQISNFEGLVTLTFYQVIPPCITHRPLPTGQISVKSKQLFVDGWMYVHMYAHTDGRTF